VTRCLQVDDVRREVACVQLVQPVIGVLFDVRLVLIGSPDEFLYEGHAANQ
jgi:hypothetical protein